MHFPLEPSPHALCRNVFMALCLLGGSTAHAFPPAPYYTLYGYVRDQVGQLVTAQGATLIVFSGTTEITRTPINSAQRVDRNYELQVRIDQNRPGTLPYTSSAVAAQSLVNIAVDIGGTRYYPVSASGRAVGKGGERVRLDLFLGEDSDNDCLPDLWEQWQLYQAGYYPDQNGRWPIDLITCDGDFDFDGQPNQLEYIAGTFAGDPSSRFLLEIKQKLTVLLDQTETEFVRMEFYGVIGKTYTLESSPDLLAWTRIDFSVATPAAGARSYLASDVGILSAFTVPKPGIKEFYRLTVR